MSIAKFNTLDCRYCNGLGIADYDSLETCEHCGGQGFIVDLSNANQPTRKALGLDSGNNIVYEHEYSLDSTELFEIADALDITIHKHFE